MIQYKYYHDLDAGYKDVYSRNAEPDDNFVFSSLGSFRRTDGSCFSYIFKESTMNICLIFDIYCNMIYTELRF